MADLTGLDALVAAVQGGAGLPDVARAAARALDASLAVTDAAGAVLAVAARSHGEERTLIGGAKGVQQIPLRLGERSLGVLHMRARRGAVEPSTLALVVTMIASEVERARAPARASESAAAGFLADLRAGRLADGAQLLARGRELSLELEAGGCAIVARAHPQAPTEEGWRRRARAVVERGAGAAAGGAIAVLSDGQEPAAEVIVLLAAVDEQAAARAAEAILREMRATLSGCALALGRSRVAADPLELRRAVDEALLAVNVAEGGDGQERCLAFDETGAYRLLLSTMSENPGELRRFYEETVAPIAAYDEQYETELTQTLDSFLEADGNVARTAERLFTHRHTIYYRLDRIRELTGLDVSSTDGREKLSLGLKAMRVLGLSSAAGPASEAGAGGGRVPRRGDPAR